MSLKRRLMLFFEVAIDGIRERLRTGLPVLTGGISPLRRTITGGHGEDSQAAAHTSRRGTAR